MFEILLSWSRASKSKCKRVIKSTLNRLMPLKKKRQAMADQVIKSAHQHIAVNKVKQVLPEDENIGATYELLDQFCVLMLKKLYYIRRLKECPDDINEEISRLSSLIYASARLGDLPELCVIRKLLEERYGHMFATTAMDLLPRNLVNIKVYNWEENEEIKKEITCGDSSISESSFADYSTIVSTIHQKSSSLDGSFSQKETKLNLCESEEDNSLKINDCSLDQPCYYLFLYDTDDDDDKKDTTHVQQRVLVDKCCSNVAKCDVSNPSTNNGSLKTPVPYSRAMTMPQEHWTRNIKDNKILRTSSCPTPSPNHVHPKLPDCDDIAAKFTALKESTWKREKRYKLDSGAIVTIDRSGY